jgi:hypothetical protein
LATNIATLTIATSSIECKMAKAATTGRSRYPESALVNPVLMPVKVSRTAEEQLNSRAQDGFHASCVRHIRHVSHHFGRTQRFARLSATTPSKTSGPPGSVAESRAQRTSRLRRDSCGECDTPAAHSLKPSQIFSESSHSRDESIVMVWLSSISRFR